MGKKALWSLSYGLYIVTTKNAKNNINGQVVNSLFQVTSEPASIAICINKENCTHEYLMESKLFGASILEQNTPFKFIGKWGFKCGRDTNKFENTNYKIGQNSVPLIIDYSIALIEGKITNSLDLGTHTLFIGEVTNQETLKDAKLLTYDYYQNVIKGKAPKNAPTFKG